MKTPHPTESQSFGKAPTGGLRESLAEAARFWEPRRLVYNLVLSAVAVGWVVATWPHFRAALTLESFAPLAVLALLANVCYCAAYLVDIGMQKSAYDTKGSTFWGTFWGADWGAGLRHRRWALWVVGTLLAVVAEFYWIADEIYPDVR